MASNFRLSARSSAGIAVTPVTIWWAVWAAVWTIAVLCGMAYLIVHRNSPPVRIRGLTLCLSAIVCLHLYWGIVQFGLMIGAIMPNDAQYWLMGTWLPCGIALFHGYNTRFLYVAKMQKKYAQYGHRLFKPSIVEVKPKKTNLVARFRALDYTTRIVITVGVGMFIQVFLTILMYLMSRKWHSSWGIPGTEVRGGAEARMKANEGWGWEWWPSLFWQFFWSWVIAPITLWKSRNIRDTQGWRVQTIGCAIANLHGTPMFLIAVYVPGMAVVNQYWLPAQWICLSILFIEIFTIFLPCWEVMRHQSLRQETLDSIARWEQKTKASGRSEVKSMRSESTLIASLSGWKSINESINSNESRDSILTMGALEHVLERNPSPLQEFSALREFSGENIAFLTSVAEWKRALPAAMKEDSTDAPTEKDLLREQFNLALHIYTQFVSARYAEFPLNLSSQSLKKLADIFEQPAQAVYGDADKKNNSVAPFDENFPFEFPSPPASATSTEFEKPKAGVKSNASTETLTVPYWGEIPGGFDAAVFDDAEASIKYLVLTNTWPKFIKDRRASLTSFETLCTSV